MAHTGYSGIKIWFSVSFCFQVSSAAFKRQTDEQARLIMRSFSATAYNIGFGAIYEHSRVYTIYGQYSLHRGTRFCMTATHDKTFLMRLLRPAL